MKINFFDLDLDSNSDQINEAEIDSPSELPVNPDTMHKPDAVANEEKTDTEEVQLSPQEQKGNLFIYLFIFFQIFHNCDYPSHYCSDYFINYAFSYAYEEKKYVIQ